MKWPEFYEIFEDEKQGQHFAFAITFKKHFIKCIKPDHKLTPYF